MSANHQGLLVCDYESTEPTSQSCTVGLPFSGDEWRHPTLLNTTCDY